MRSPRTWIILASACALIALAVPVATALGDGPSDEQLENINQRAVSVGSGFTYQGRLEEGGVPSTGLFDLRFRLFDSEVGGAQVESTVEAPAAVVIDGLFTVELDFGGAAFRGEARWLEVAVRESGAPTDYSVLTPRQPISAVPYALWALAADVALPFAGSSTSANPTPLFSLTQSGSGAVLEARRGNAGETEAPALYGSNDGSGAGVQGETTADGGVALRGITTGPASIAVEGSSLGAAGAGAVLSGETGAVVSSTNGSVALEVSGGGIKVSGASPPAFRQTVVTTGEASNLCGTNGTVLAHSLLDGVPSAMVFVSKISANGAIASAADAQDLVLAYSPDTTCPEASGKWVLFVGGAPLVDGQSFNVLVVSQ